MADSRGTSASNARHRRRNRDANTDMMETDIDTNTSGSSYNRTGQATYEQGTGESELRLERTREFVNMAKRIAAIQPEIEREFAAVETMVYRASHIQTGMESEAIRDLERQIAELREENAQLKLIVDSSESKHGAHRHYDNTTLGIGNDDVKLRATESLNHQLKEEVKKLQDRNRDTDQKLDKSQKQLSQALDEIQKERKAREESQEQNTKWKEVQNKCEAYFKKQEREIEKMQQQLRENTETISALTDVKEHLNQMINDKESTIQEQKKMLESERKDLDETKSRLSKMMGDQMKDGNPYIADLSDKNRPTKIADLYNELYDNEWTDAFDVIQKTAYTGTQDRDIAKQLYDILMDITTFCKKEAKVQAELIKQSLQVDVTGGTLVSSTPQQLKEFQRSNADCGAQGVYQKYMKYNRTRTGMLSHNTRKVPDFVRKCIEVCWIMALQDPPLDFKDEIQSYAQFSKDEFKAYTKLGQYIDFVVWPPLLLHKGGPLLAKGVAQGLGTQQTGMKSPDARNKETSFTMEPRQTWSTTTCTYQTGPYPSTSTGTAYAQSPSVYPASAVASSQYEQTIVTPSSYPGTAVPLAYDQSLSPSVRDARATSQPLTTAQAHLAQNVQALALNQNPNAELSYPRQKDGHSSGNVTQSFESQSPYGSQSSQPGASPYGNDYYRNLHMYPNNQWK